MSKRILALLAALTTLLALGLAETGGAAPRLGGRRRPSICRTRPTGSRRPTSGTTAGRT